MIDHYKVLKVSPDATQETIRAQYLFLLQAFHPDKFAGAGRESHLAQAEAETKKLNLAYEVLGYPARRRDFDRQREAEMARSRGASGAASRQPPPSPPPPPPPPRASTTRTPPPHPPRSPYRWNVKRTVVLAVVAIASSVLVESNWLVDKHKKDTAANSNSGDTNPVAKLVTMTPAQAYSYGYGQIQPQFDSMLAAARDDLYPGSVTNQMRRRGGGNELTPANVAEEMRKACAEVEQDQEVKAELRGKAAQEGVSKQVLDSYLQGRLAGVAALDRTNGQTPQLAESEQARVPPPASSPSGATSNQQPVSDNRPLLEAVISMCDVYGANEAHRTDLPNIKQEENGEWDVTVPVKNIRDDQRQANNLGLMALLLAHTFSEQVNGAVVKCTMTGENSSGLSEDLVTANSTDFQPTCKAYMVHEDAFPAANQHGWAVCRIKSDPTTVSKEVVPLSPEIPVLRIFPVKKTGAGAFSVDDQKPLLTVYTLSAIQWTGNKPTITLNEKDMIAYATITRKYSHDFLYFAANADTGEMARIEGEFTDGKIAFIKPEDEAIASYFRARFLADGISRYPVDNDHGFRLYVNRAQRYSVIISALLASTLRENASGDNVTAASEDGRIKLLMRVKQGVGTAETLYKQWTAEHTVKDPGKVVDYKTFHGNWFVVSGHDGPRGYYVKVVTRGSESLFLCLEYDEEQSSNLGAMLTEMSRSFTGDLNPSSGNRVQATPSASVGAAQIGAEKIKHPVRAQISLAHGGQMYGTEPIGNVEVTYMDGTKDWWTTNGDCGQAHLAADGTVGWTVYDPERKAATASYSTRPNRTLMLCKQGRTVSKINSALGYIEDWHFLNDGSEIGLRTRALHGVALLERHSSATGELLESVKAYESGLPAWAMPFADR